MEPEAKQKITSEDLVTDEQINQVLLADIGRDAQLKSWKLVSFTNRGDNYACTVMAVEVKYYTAIGKELEAFYVVKLNPRRDADFFKDMTNVIFIKEANFYIKLLPELNAVLNSIGQPSLQLPRCFHSSLEVGKEQIYFEDLRKRDFKMFDRKRGMDVPHTSLVLKEMARLHAASLLLQDKTSEPIEVKHDYLLKNWFNMTDNAKDVLLPMMEANVTNGVEILQRIGANEKAIQFVEGLKSQIEGIFSTEMLNGKYDVVCHGDCWNNNILFRYNSNNVPVEVMLLDLQICRKGSPAIDLNQFMYTSLNSDVRRPNLNNFLNTYYESFKGVFDTEGSKMPFSEDEISQEFRDKNTLGAMFSIMAIPMLLMEPDDVPDTDMGDQDLEEFGRIMREKALSMLDKNPLVKPRFLATFDEFMETGLIS